MTRHIRATLAVAVLNIGLASVAFSQQPPSQVAPKDVLPPTPQRPTVSPTLTVTTPGTISESSPIRATAEPQAPPPPSQSVPVAAQPGMVLTNVVQVSGNGQPVPSGARKPSPWDLTNAVPSSSWANAAANPGAPAPAKPASNPWSQPPNAGLWDSTVPLGSSGTKTEWK